MTETRDNLFPADKHPSRMQTTADPQPCQACAVAEASGAAFCPQCGSDLRKSKSDVSAAKSAPPAETTDNSEHIPSTPMQELIKAAAESQPKTKHVLSEKTADESAPVKCSCGKVLPDDARYCSKCGLQIGQRIPRYGLRHLSNANDGQVIPITDEELTIGKSADCGLVITNDEYVSRRHARIFQTDGMLFLEDLNSSNGTFMRPRRPIIIEAGDEIMIGTSVFRLEETGN